jgi:hypothetical protein
MGGKMNAHWAGRLMLALLILGWAALAAPARADEPAKELTQEERGKLAKEGVELTDKAIRQYQDGHVRPLDYRLRRNRRRGRDP